MRSLEKGWGYKMKNFEYSSDSNDFEWDIEYLKDHDRDYYYELLNASKAAEEVAELLEKADCFLHLHAMIDRDDVSIGFTFYYNDDLADKVHHVCKYTPPFDPDFEHVPVKSFSYFQEDFEDDRKFKYILSSSEILPDIDLERFIKKVLDYIDEEDRCVECNIRSKKYGDYCRSCAVKYDGAGTGAELLYLEKKVQELGTKVGCESTDPEEILDYVSRHMGG
jgi:hypothetical protein